MLPYIQTTSGISVAIGGQMHTIAAGRRHYFELIDAIQSDASEDEILSILKKDLQHVTSAVKSLQDRKLTDDVAIRGGRVTFRGEPIHDTLTERILQQVHEGFDLVPMALLLQNIMQNPSHRAVRDTYPFLEHGKMPITKDGCFIALKAVRADYRDIYSGTFDNSIGQTIEMPRNRVDEDPDKPCSAGLHVCSYDYLKSFARPDGHVMVCKVNPRDVVSIPRDHGDTKMRVCRYEVIGEFKDFYTRPGINDLADISIATDKEPFLVTITGHEPSTRRYAKLTDAAAAAETALALTSTEEVVIENGVTGVELDRQSNPNFDDDEGDGSDGDGGH